MKKTVSLSFDIEDWFQVENLRAIFPHDTWEDVESRVEKNTQVILDILKQYKIKGTFFFLGWIAERYPDLVKEVHSQGHEIASHGYYHKLNYQMSYESIQRDIEISKNIIENIIGEKIVGYRAPNFSITDDVLDALKHLNFKYDSSFHPFSKNTRYGTISLNITQPTILDNGLAEIPMSVWKKGPLELSVAGGGYLRLISFPIFKRFIDSFLSKNNILVFYLHPWEFDPEQPRVSGIRLDYKFRHYVGLRKTYEKFTKLIEYLIYLGCEFKTLKDVAENLEGE